jgi:TRAP-type transport system periplasmic protein
MGNKITRFTVMAFCTGLIICLLYGSAGADTYTMKLGIVTLNDPIHAYINEFKNRIEARTNGRIKAEVYPGAQLGGTPRLIDGIQLGTIEMILLPPGFFKGVNPAFEVTDAPGLFKDLDHAHASLTDREFRDEFLKIAEDRGVVGVSLWVHGPTSYASLTPLRTLEDFRGKKIRVLATKVETDLMRSIGATGVPMEFSEITPGLQRKALDGVRSNIMVLTGIKVFSVAQNITLANDSMIPVVAMASKKFMDRLPADLRDAVLEVGRDMERHMLQVAKDYNTSAVEEWSKNGKIFHLNEGDQKMLMENGARIAEEILGTREDTKELFRILKAVAEKHNK